jgi:hypothetical protein
MMPRRTFLASSAVSGAGAASAVAAAATVAAAAAPAKPGGGGGGAGGKGKTPEWYELRTYRLRIGPQPKLVGSFLAEVALPALKRLGVGPVGAFETIVGPVMPAVHLLIPYESPAAMASAHARLAADAAYQKGLAGAAASAPAGQPYQRVESTLMVAFDHMPRLEPPPAAAGDAAKGRVFELRTYESPNETASAKKMEMFSKLGETEIFRRVGLTPVFFGKAVVGPRLPCFMYLLAFADMAARDKAWATFRADPEWQKLRATPGYTDAEIMSNISDELLRPAAYSQI